MRSNLKVFDPARNLWQFAPSEEHVILDIRECLGLNGAVTHRIIERIPYGKRTSEPGVPDLAGWFPKPTVEHPGFVFPLHFWIEAKKPGGRRRPAQIAWIEAAQRDGVCVFFASSRDEMVAEFLERGIELKVK